MIGAMLRTLSTAADPPETIRAALTQTSFVDRSAEEAGVRAILEDVRARGDAAVRDVTERYDGVRLERFEVTEAELPSGDSLAAELTRFLRERDEESDTPREQP